MSQTKRQRTSRKSPNSSRISSRQISITEEWCCDVELNSANPELGPDSTLTKLQSVFDQAQRTLTLRQSSKHVSDPDQHHKRMVL